MALKRNKYLIKSDIDNLDLSKIVKGFDEKKQIKTTNKQVFQAARNSTFLVVFGKTFGFQIIYDFRLEILDFGYRKFQIPQNVTKISISWFF